MTILFFSRLFYPHIGGVEKHVLEISKILVEKGYSVTVLTEKFERGLLDTDEIDGIKILRIDNGKDNWSKKFRVWKNILRNINLIKEADIIHIHDVFFWYMPFKIIFPLKKVFVTFHGYEGNKIPGFKSKLMHKIAEKLSKGNICVGDFLKKWYGTRPDYVTYGAVEVSSIKYPSFVKSSIKYKVLSINKNRLKFLFIGRLEEETGIMEYLKALKILKGKKYKFEITILGDGSLKKKAQDFCLVNQIGAHFMGFVKDVNQYINNSDFVFTSRYLGILESLAFKKFIFTHYNNSIKKDYLEMAPFAKYISISKNYKELSDEIEHFLKKESEKNLMISKGYDWVGDQTWEKMIDLYLKLWNVYHL